MTKKAERAARIAADKRAKWLKKVRTLTGHLIYERMDVLAADVAYYMDATADTYAAELASREPVGKSVHPLKVQAVERAEAEAVKEIEAVRAKMAAGGWDLNVVAPYPESNMNRDEYQKRVSRHHKFARLTKTAAGHEYRGHRQTDVREMSKEGCEREITKWRESAAFQYDAFICKLVRKIGPCASATLTGSHVWSHSILTVTKLMDVGDNHTTVTEHWKTQQIENRSVLGLYFPQWPTRLVKGGY